MALISPEITLLIAGELGTRDLFSLMLTCKANYRILKSRERSVAKSIIVRTNPLQDPTCPVLSSSTENRWILESPSFEVVAELERRAARIDRLVDGTLSQQFPVLVCCPFHKVSLFSFYTSPQPFSLAGQLKQSCLVLDQIADIAATVCLASASGTSSSLRSLQPLSDAALRPGINRARRAFVETLDIFTVVFLGILFKLALKAHWVRNGQGWQHPRTIVNILLRHGSTALFSLTVQPRNAREWELWQFYDGECDRDAQDHRNLRTGWRPDLFDDFPSGVQVCFIEMRRRAEAVMQEHYRRLKAEKEQEGGGLEGNNAGPVEIEG